MVRCCLCLSHHCRTILLLLKFIVLMRLHLGFPHRAPSTTLRVSFVIFLRVLHLRSATPTLTTRSRVLWSRHTAIATLSAAYISTLLHSVVHPLNVTGVRSTPVLISSPPLDASRLSPLPSTMASPANQQQNPNPAPPSSSAGGHDMRDYYATQDALRPPSQFQEPYLTPYLGLRARLSQTWINR